MDAITLGKLEPVDLRSVWNDEARSFTPWLAQEENIQVLGETIGVELEVDATEVAIGSFRADIVCKTIDDATMVIENQLDKTNHDHLGKIITYASGLGAKYIVWICRLATEEHRQAVDWLNETSVDGINYFLLEIELFQIGDSEPAPYFKIVCSPNEWAKTIIAPPKALSKTQQQHLDFWNGLKEHMTTNGTFLNLRTPRPQHWYGIAVGRSKFSLGLTRNTTAQRLGCEIYLRGKQAKIAFGLIKEVASEIEQAVGTLNWEELPEGQDCRIIQYRDAPVSDQADWSNQYAWLQERAEGFHKTFSSRIQALEL